MRVPLRDGGYQPVAANPAFSLYGLTFVVHKYITHPDASPREANGFTVSESQTGRLIATGLTVKEAKERAYAILQAAGEAATSQAVADAPHINASQTLLF